MAESPPPITAISLPEKKKPSQVAQEETPWPINACSLGRPSQRADAPLDNERAGLNALFSEAQLERMFAQIGLDHVAHAIFGAEARGLLAHVLDQFRPLDAFGKPGKIFHQRGHRQLSARFMAFDHERLEVGAGAVEGGGVTGAPRAYDHNIAYIHSSKKCAKEIGVKQTALLISLPAKSRHKDGLSS